MIGLLLLLCTLTDQTMDGSAIARQTTAQNELGFLALESAHEMGLTNSAASPLSIGMALGLVANASAGLTQMQVLGALGADDLAVLNAAQSQSRSRFGALQGVQMDQANGVFVHQGAELRPEYAQTVEQVFGAQVQRVPGAQLLPTVNGWVKERTHGLIPKLFDQIDPSTEFVLANAMYFKGAWEDAFDLAASREREFFTPAGPVQAMTMQASRSMEFMQSESGYRMARLPFQNGDLAMVFVLPPESRSFSLVLQDFRADYATWRRDLRRTQLSLRVPRFEARARFDLIPILRRAGVTSAFGGGANFRGISPRGSGLFIDQAVHEAVVKVDEKGAEAAAATGVTLSRSMSTERPELHLDRTFLYAIEETATGTILFAGYVQDPRHTR